MGSNFMTSNRTGDYGGLEVLCRNLHGKSMNYLKEPQSVGRDCTSRIFTILVLPPAEIVAWTLELWRFIVRLWRKETGRAHILYINPRAMAISDERLSTLCHAKLDVMTDVFLQQFHKFYIDFCLFTLKIKKCRRGGTDPRQLSCTMYLHYWMFLIVMVLYLRYVSCLRNAIPCINIEKQVKYFKLNSWVTNDDPTCSDLW